VARALEARVWIAWLGVAAGVLGPAPARADGEATDAMADRHVLELTLGGGMSLVSDDPARLDLGVGGQLAGRAMVDVEHARVDARVVMRDPSRPDRFQLRGDGRLLFLAVHDFTWRVSDAGELLRLFGGVGGEITLPGDVGELTLSLGFAMVRLGSAPEVERQLSESYGPYAGLTARLRFWEIRDELRVAVHGLVHPSDFGLALDLAPMIEQLALGVTVSNRLYLQALRAGGLSAGPELTIQYEGLLEGEVVFATLGIAGTFAL
jgi:hypothetical protein